MKTRLIAFAIFACTFACAQANLITNGDFESGLSGWQTFGPATLTDGHDSAFGAVLHGVDNNWSGILQHIDGLNPSASYDLSFFIRINGEATGGLVMSWNHHAIFELVNPSQSGYYQVNLTGLQGSSVDLFINSGAPLKFSLDDIWLREGIPGSLPESMPLWAALPVFAAMLYAKTKVRA